MSQEHFDLPSDVNRERKWEYLDHPADVIIHAWGRDYKEALENSGEALTGYMTEITEVNPVLKEPFSVRLEPYEEANKLNLTNRYKFLEELLFLFYERDSFLTRCVRIKRLDLKQGAIDAHVYGEHMDLSRHEQGTEIKAITLHGMEIDEGEDGDNRCDIHFLIDI
ncbi:Protein archease [Perkinsus olseni]|uniref:Protein archease n=1 Tax=Perkinsus olseni TaxID=32597 RepID=A0A7J6RGT5_PEROL|nr:Protein archease [Perkinsus olseni]KAF4718890.1 Protein archease [Perkinsus olseni]